MMDNKTSSVCVALDFVATVLFPSRVVKSPKILFFVIRILNTLGSYCQNVKPVSPVLVYIKQNSGM